MSNNIAIFSDGIAPFSTGGMQSHTRNMVADFAQIFDTVYLFLPTSATLKTCQQVLDLYPQAVRDKVIVELIDRPAMKVNFPGRYVLEEMGLSKAMFIKFRSLNLNVKCIYAQGFTGWSKQNGDPSILVHLHGYEFLQAMPGLWYGLKSRFLGIFFKRLIRRADFLISLGGKITELIKRLGVDESRIIEHLNGMDGIVEHQTRLDKNTFIFVARNEARKGAKELFKAWVDVSDRGHLHIIGDFEPIELQNATFHGLVSDREVLKNLYKSAEFIILPSHSEGMPMVLLEAAMQGCIPICTDVGAISSYFEKDEAIWINFRDISSVKNGIIEALDLKEDKKEKMRKSFGRRSDYFTRKECALRFQQELIALDLC
jgi:glycosyltransferase involved in cell wall biosynthesis